MLECDLTPTRAALQQARIERRQRIAQRAINDQGIALQRPVGVNGRQAEENKRAEVLEAARADLEAKTATQAAAIKQKIAENGRDWLWPPVQEVNPARAGKLPANFIHRIKQKVAAEYICSINDMEANRRDKIIVLPRHISIYLCKTLTLKSLPELGRQFGDRDHTTILFAIRKITRLMLTNEWLCLTVVELQDGLEREIVRWRAGC